MREISSMKEGAPGAVPGASTELTQQNPSGSAGTTEQCSVEIAKPLPTCAQRVASPPEAGSVAERCAICGKKVCRTPEICQKVAVGEPIVKRCRKCTEEDVFTALDVASEVDLCDYHLRTEQARTDCLPRAEAALVDSCPLDGNPCRGQGTVAECDRCLGRSPLKETFGKNGRRPLVAMPERARPARGDRLGVRATRRNPTFEPGTVCAQSESHFWVRLDSGVEVMIGYDQADQWTPWPTVEESEQPNHKAAQADVLATEAMRDAYEYAWQKLAEDSNLDPLTVATCKRLRDLELRP